MATLANQTVVVVGGSSGLGYAVAKASLLALAAHVIVASKTPKKVKDAVARLESDPDVKQLAAPGKVTGATVDATDVNAIKTFFEGLGEVDHVVYTSGDPLKLGWPNIDLNEIKGT